jgi:hypothetical protein
MIGPGPRMFQDGDFVRTYKGVGRVVGCKTGYAPTHDSLIWYDEWGWSGDGDEYMEHVYQVEMDGEVWPWPEDSLETATILDAMAWS